MVEEAGGRDRHREFGFDHGPERLPLDRGMGIWVRRPDQSVADQVDPVVAERPRFPVHEGEHVNGGPGAGRGADQPLQVFELVPPPGSRLEVVAIRGGGHLVDGSVDRLNSGAGQKPDRGLDLFQVADLFDQSGTGSGAGPEVEPGAGRLHRLVEEIALAGEDDGHLLGAVTEAQEVVQDPDAPGGTARRGKGAEVANILTAGRRRDGQPRGLA